MGKTVQTAKKIHIFSLNFLFLKQGKHNAAELRGKTSEWRNCNYGTRQKISKITKEEIIGCAYKK